MFMSQGYRGLLASSGTSSITTLVTQRLSSARLTAVSPFNSPPYLSHCSPSPTYTFVHTALNTLFEFVTFSRPFLPTVNAIRTPSSPTLLALQPAHHVASSPSRLRPALTVTSAPSPLVATSSPTASHTFTNNQPHLHHPPTFLSTTTFFLTFLQCRQHVSQKIESRTPTWALP